VELLMPAKSEKQRRFMAAVANNPKFAKKVGVPQNVGKEFTMKKYQSGGPAMSMRPKMRPKDMAAKRSMRPRRRPEDMEIDMSVDTAVGRGNRASMREAEDMRTLGPGMKSGGKVKKMAGGGSCGTKMYAKGGKVRGDGVCSKGRTKGRMV
jgi:hypothetical protein